MRGLWGGRWRKRGQNASGATAGRDITLINEVHGSVSIVTSPPRIDGEEEKEKKNQEKKEDRAVAAYAAYAARVRQRYGRLDLAVLTPLRDQDEHPAVELRDVFVPQSVRADPPPVELPQELLRRLKDGTEADHPELPPGVERETVERVRRAYRERPPMPVLDVLADPALDRIVVLGNPGAGKSTLARYLALALTAPEPPPELAALADRLPIVVELRSYAQAEWRERGFEEFLAHQYATEGLSLPPDLLADLLGGERERRLLLLFDGLDELFETAVRDAVTRRIAAFAARHPGVRVVVTSRGYGYRGAVLDAVGFTTYMLQDLDRDQITAFTRQWFALSCPGDPVLAGKLTERVATAVDGSRSVAELAGNPLILTILAIIGRRRELPRDRAKVYEQAVAVLVEHWDPGKFLKDRKVEEHLPYLDAEDRLTLLRLVARRMQEGHGGVAGNHIAGPDLIESFEGYLKDRYELPKDRAVTAARIMLEQFRGRNFILSHFGGEVYGFVHRTFLEYLAATDIARRFSHERALSEEELQDLFTRRLPDPAWDEILLLLIGQIDEPFAARVLDRVLAPRTTSPSLRTHRDTSFTEVAFAARCLGEIRRVGLLAPQSERIVRRVIRLLELARVLGVGFFHPYDKLQAIGRALAALGEGWPGRRIYLDWYEEWSREDVVANPLAINVVPFLAADIRLSLLRAGGESAERARDEAMERSVSPVARVAAAYADVGRDADRWEKVCRRAAEDPDPAVRSALLGLAGRSDAPAGTVLAMLDRMREDEDEQVRAEALGARLGHLLAEPDPEAYLAEARRDDPSARVGALRAVNDGNAAGPEIWAWVREALRDADAGVRTAAVRTVGRVTAGRREEGIALLHTLMEREEDAEVLDAALHVLLYDLGVRSDEMRLLLLDRATGPSPAALRAPVARNLSYLWPSDPEVRAAMRELGRNDPAPEVRVAVFSTAEQSEDDEDWRELRQEAIRHDPDAGVREAALSAVGPFLLPSRRSVTSDWTDLLREVAAGDESGDVRGAALGELIRLGWTGPAIVDFVRHRAVTDELPAVRAFALSTLATEGAPDPLTLAHDRLTNDEDPAVRLSALRVLADGGRDDPHVLELVRGAAAGDSSAEVRDLAGRLVPILASGFRTAR
ncbi:HEAT repeat domain-containing protein [Streptomyces sp. NPDC048659]|uniref:NACHT domain-containing protein n=1 Tax=Streptomyces sp. NPDC048659 TaxID=3155489 RepID=UPI003412BFFE